MSKEPQAVSATLARPYAPGQGLAWRLLKFILAITLAGLITFGLLPALQKLPPVAPGASIIIEHDIEAGAFYYTDVGKMPEAEAFIRSRAVAGMEESP